MTEITDELKVYKLDGPGYGSSTVTLEEWREADIIINDKGYILKDTSSKYPKGVIPMGIKKPKATAGMIESAKLIRHAFYDDELGLEDIAEDD